MGPENPKCRRMGCACHPVRSSKWELVCIRAFSLAHCSPFWCWERFVWVPHWCPDDLVLIKDMLEKCISKLKAWKAGRESTGLRIFMKKTKLLVFGVGVDVLKNMGKYPCAVVSAITPSRACSPGCVVHTKCTGMTPDSMARWAHVGPTWSRQDPHWANVGPTKFAFGDCLTGSRLKLSLPRFVMARLGPSTADQWLKWMWTAPWLMWKSFSATKY